MVNSLPTLFSSSPNPSIQNSLWTWLPIYRELLIGLATGYYMRLRAKHILLVPRDYPITLVVSFRYQFFWYVIKHLI